jgi:hypothetical protein
MSISPDKLVEIAIQQKNAGEKVKDKRLEDIRKNEDLYLNKVRPALKGRFNVPFPFMGGFVDTLMSKVDDPPSLTYTHQDEADYKKAKKTTGAWQKDYKDNKWARKDRWSKKLAAFSGRAIFLKYSESDPEYKSYLEVLDYNDFYNEPNGGGDNEDHLFCGIKNRFLTKSQLRRGAQSGLYDEGQVSKLLVAYETGDYKKVEKEAENKYNRAINFGLDAINNNYVGQNIYNTVMHFMDFDGVRYLLQFDLITGIWFKCVPLKEAFGTSLYPIASWATHEDPFVFWSKAPCDDLRPVCDSMTTILNQALENRQKRNFGQRAYDIDIFTDPSQLEFRPDGLVPVSLIPGKSIQNGIYEFKTEEVSGTIDLVSYLNNLAGQKSGITPEAEGSADANAKVGIYYGNMQQVADRFSLLNKSYSEAWEELGIRYALGLEQNCPEEMMIRLTGAENGVEWDKITKPEDVKPSVPYTIIVKGSREEEKLGLVNKEKKEKALAEIRGDEELRKEVNKKWMLQEILKNAEYDDETLKVALDPTNEYDQEILSEAASENKEMLLGQKVEPNRGATEGHIKKHLRMAYDNELKEEAFKAILDHIDQEIPLAKYNAMEKAKKIILAAQIQAGLNALAQPMMAPAGVNQSMPNNINNRTLPINVPEANSPANI